MFAPKKPGFAHACHKLGYVDFFFQLNLLPPYSQGYKDIKPVLGDLPAQERALCKPRDAVHSCKFTQNL